MDIAAGSVPHPRKKYIDLSYKYAMLISMSRQDTTRRRDRQPGGARAAAAAALYGLVTGAVRRIPHELSLTSASTLATLERTGPGGSPIWPWSRG